MQAQMPFAKQRASYSVYDDTRGFLVHCILSFLLIVLLLFSIPPAVVASTYVDIEDIETYNLLSRLEAEGVITDGLLSTRPLSRKEVVRLIHEAETNAQDRSEFVKGLVQALKQRIKPEEFEAGMFKPLDSAYVGYVNTNADVLTLTYGSTREKEQSFNHNNNGDLYDRGSNYRAGFTSRAEKLGPFSLYLNPEFQSGGGHEQVVLKKGYGVLGFSWIDIVAGKDSQWWGPGYNGGHLISNNAEPFTMIKFTGPGPQRLPWILKYLGPFQYTLFIARLEKDRGDFPEPYLNGLRFDFKPFPFLEIGLERIVLLDGHGKPVTASDWIKSIIGIDAHPNEAGPDETNSEAGGDVKLTLPFKTQPFQVYWQRDGEDGRQRTFGLPYKFADLYGVYLPRVLVFESIGLRAEYAVNHVKGWPNVWYTHSVYTSGMTYKEMIFGHHMGTDSRNFFLELSYLLLEQNARFYLSYDHKTHNLSAPVRQVSDEVSLKAELLLSQHIDVTASYGYGRIENLGNMTGPAINVHEAAAELRYWF
jgi:hypothetical protein